MFERLGFSAAAATELTTTEAILSLNDLRCLNSSHVAVICKALCTPGGAGAGVAVPEKAGYNLDIAAHVVNHWKLSTRDSKSVADL